MPRRPRLVPTASDAEEGVDHNADFLDFGLDAMGKTVVTFGTTVVAFPGVVAFSRTGNTFTIATLFFGFGRQGRMPEAGLRLRGVDDARSAAAFAVVISSLFGTGANLTASTLHDAAIPLAAVAVSFVCDDVTD